MIANALNLRDCAHPARSAASPSLTLALGGEDGVGSEGFLRARLWRCTDQQAGRATAMGGHQVGSSCISTNIPLASRAPEPRLSGLPLPVTERVACGARRPPGPAPVPPGAHWCRGPRELARWPRTSDSDTTVECESLTLRHGPQARGTQRSIWWRCPGDGHCVRWPGPRTDASVTGGRCA